MAFQGDSIYWVEVEKVVPNPFQPRREFDQNKLQELADSIRMYGVLQPLTVTRKEVQQDSGTFYTEYELIAGERRLRASKLAGVAQVPVIIREGEQSEQEKLELAIIENLQREDLNAVDRAIAFKQLAEAFGLSHAQVAQKVGRSREYVSNSIRLLGLPDHMLESLKHGDMMEGHARTLLMLTDRPEEQEVVYKEILLKKLSVREVERIVRKIATDKVRKKQPGELDSNLIEFEKQFTETLGTRVQIQKTDFGGKLTIDYFSTEDLEGILERMKDEEKRQAVLSANDEVSKLKEHTPLDIASENTQPAASVAPETTVPKLEVTPETSEMLASETAVVEPGDDFKQPEKSELPVATPETVIPKTEEVPGRSLVNQPSQNPVEPNSPEPLSEIPSAPVSPNSEIKQTVQYGYGNQENSHTQSQFVPRELENRTEAPIDPAVKTEDRRPAEPIVEQPIRPAAFSVPQYQPSVQVGYTNPQAEQANTELIKPDTAVSPVPPTPAQSRSPEMETEKLADSDESDMYSVRNFGV